MQSLLIEQPCESFATPVAVAAGSDEHPTENVNRDADKSPRTAKTRERSM